MATTLGWLHTALVIGLFTAIGVSLVCGAALLLFDRVIEEIEPRRRLWILRALAWSPAVAAALITLIAFYPPLLDLAGIAVDHCLSHPGHELYLCFLHSPPPEISPLVSGLALGATLLIVYQWWVQLRALLWSRRWTDQLVGLATYEEDLDAYVVESDHLFAVTVGLLNRRVLLTERMKQILSPTQLRAVLAHEDAHRRRLDAVNGLLTGLLAVVFWPGLRRRLLDAIDLAAEQCCDQAAAQAVDDHLIVAETLLAVARGFTGHSTPRGVMAFGSSRIEKRVEALLHDDWRRPSILWTPALAALLIALPLTNLHFVHHAIEHATAWLT